VHSTTLLLYAGAALAMVGVWVGGLVYLDIFTPDDVKSWRRLAALRGYATPRSRAEKLASQAPILQRIQQGLDLTTLLAIADRTETPMAFMAKGAGLGLGVAALLALAQIVYALANHEVLIGLWLPFVIGASAMTAYFSQLRSQVRKRQENCNQALGDMLMMVAIMTDSRGLQLEDAVRILARCTTTASLDGLVNNRGYARLVKTPHRSTIELYRMIAETYGIPMFAQVADSAANTNVGFGERDTYTRLAKVVYQGRLAEAKMRAARAKILVTIPVAGMLLPLLFLLGLPTMASLGDALK
jgi:hypothetical protein